MQADQLHVRRRLGYRKFRSPPFQFLFLKYDYFGQVHMVNALRRQGHGVIELPQPHPATAEASLDQIVKQAAEHQVDALITMNNMGLDNLGVITTELSRLGLPTIQWFVDNYRFTGPHFAGDTPELVLALSTDRRLVPVLGAAGFRHVDYLPLAADIGFTAIRFDERYTFLRDRVSYVGGTFSKMVANFHSANHDRLYRQWRPDFATEKAARGSLDLEATFGPYRHQFPDQKAYYRFMAYVVFQETRRYRAGRLKGLLEEPLTVFGTDDWLDFLPEDVVHKPVAYHLETPNVYRNSAVNLSLTTFQQEAALNQRLFDVPLCNGFVLSDWQESLAEHFEPGKELIVFHDDDELRDQVRYYLGHPEAREQIVRKARDRILREHLMEHRVTTMLDLAAGIFA